VRAIATGVLALALCGDVPEYDRSLVALDGASISYRSVGEARQLAVSSTIDALEGECHRLGFDGVHEVGFEGPFCRRWADTLVYVPIRGATLFAVVGDGETTWRCTTLAIGTCFHGEPP